jgi:polyhydroxyalkanoate synthesis regulator phasin
MPRIRRSNKVNKEANHMANQPVPMQLSVVPGLEAQKEIENTLDAPRRLSETIEDLEKKRADAQAELAQSLAKDLAAGPLNVDSAVEKYKAWKAKDDALAAKIKIAEELRPIIDERIEELKDTQAEALKAVIRRKLDELQKEAEVEKDKAELIEKQIESLTKLLGELEKPASAAVAKSKKE